MTDTINIVNTIKALFGILANSERDSEAVRDSLADLAKDPDFLTVFKEVMEELGSGIHIHVHENHTHFHTHNHQRDNQWVYPTYPRITWNEVQPDTHQPITISSSNSLGGGDGAGAMNVAHLMEEAQSIIQSQ